MTATDHDLKQALYNWRREIAGKKIPPAIVRTYGPNLFMSDIIVERLVAYSRAGKAETIDQIVKETGWRRNWAEEFSDSLIALLSQALPSETAEPL